MRPDAKRSRHQSPLPVNSRDLRNLPTESFITPKAKRPFTSRLSTRSSAYVTPKRERRQTYGYSTQAAYDFHGIPGSEFGTLILTDTSHASLLASSAASAYFSHRPRKGKKSVHASTELAIPTLTVKSFEAEKPEPTPLDAAMKAKTFDAWTDQIELGHNLLIYGFGSTIELLETFGKSPHCDDGAVLSVHAFRGVTARDILLKTADFYFDLEDFSKAMTSEILGRIREDGRKLYLLVHSIDHETLRTKQDQVLLAKIASVQNIVMIASMKHVNGNLLWDTQITALFGWSMYAVHTYQHYVEETANRPLVLNPVKEEKVCVDEEVDVAVKILTCFVSNARQIFILLAQEEMQTEPFKTPLKPKSVLNEQGNGSTDGTARAEGVAFDVLYKKCRERFLISNTSILRSHLHDFVQHDLVAKARDDRGRELYSVQMEKDVVTRVIAALTN